MLLYYITDRKGLGEADDGQRSALLRRIGEAARAGVDYIQLREKDLSPRDLERLAREALAEVRENSRTTRLLINERADVALACGADGVHLPAGQLSAFEVRALWTKCCDREPLIGVSAHSAAEVRVAKAQGADLVVLAPIFEKVQTGTAGIGTDAIRQACSAGAEACVSGQFAVLALGGVNLANARACLEAGAAGVAGIRLFQRGDLQQTVRQLRDL